MSTVRRLFAALAASASAAALVAAPAAAAPTKSPQIDEPITANCGSAGQIVVVVAPGNGSFTPAFVVGTHQIFVPYRFVFTETVDGVTTTDTVAKRAPLPANNVTCTFSETVTVDGETFTFTGTVTGVFRGKP